VQGLASISYMVGDEAFQLVTLNNALD